MATQMYNAGNDATPGASNSTHFYDRAGLKKANSVNIFQQLADERSMPQKWGKEYRVSRWNNIYDRAYNKTKDSDFDKFGYMTKRDLDEFSSSSNKLGSAASLMSESGSPHASHNEQSITKRTLKVTQARYGAMIKYTDELEIFYEDEIQVRYREQLGEHANNLMEDLIQHDMLNSPTVMYGGGAGQKSDVGNNGSSTVGTVDYDLVRKMYRKIKQNRGKPHTKLITGSTKVDTKTVAPSYFAITSPEVIKDLEMVTNITDSTTDTARKIAWVDAHQYAAAGNLAEGEQGKVHHIRFIEAERMFVDKGAGKEISSGNVNSSKVQYSNKGGKNKCDLHPIIIATKGSFATIGLKGRKKIEFIVNDPNNESIGNPYRTVGSFAYKFHYAGLITDEPGLLVTWVAVTS